MNDRQNLLDKVKDSFWKYKELENTKILQIFHVTVLVIIALFSEVIKNNIFAEYSLMIALLFIALGYFLLYLTDIYMLLILILMPILKKAHLRLILLKLTKT